MTINLKLKPALFVIALSCSQHVFAQSAQSDVTPQPLLANSAQEVKPANKARVVFGWGTWADGLGITKTEISVDKSVVCEVNKNAKICDISIEPGKREIALSNNLDFGTYSEQFNLEAGKRYQIEVVLNQKNFWVDSLFLGLPVSALVNEKGKTASYKFKLANVSDEQQK
jgi:hypothetical protein